MELIICEKPSVAKEFASILGKHFNVSFAYNNGTYTDGNIVIGAARGHLLELAQPHDYNENYKKWNIADLPIIPGAFKLNVSADKRKLFNLLDKQIRKADVIYNATDAGREGELIFRYILNASQHKPSCVVKRIWADDTEEKTLINAYQNAKNQSEYDSLYYSAKARNEADWLIGINATRTLTVASKSNKMLSLGRVQTAILRLIVDRYLINKNFKKQDVFTPVIVLEQLVLKANKGYSSLAEAKALLENINDPILLEKNVESKTIRQPALFSLPDLQIQASRLLNFSATKTLDIAQKLYEQKAISYPRTDSNYLNTNQKDTISKTLTDFISQNLHLEQKNIENSLFLKSSELSSHFIFNDAKTSDHFAIIPLSKDYNRLMSTLNDEEQALYNLIFKRFIQTFMHPAIVEQTSYKAKVNDDIYYYANGKVIKTKGFYLFDNVSDTSLPNLESKSYHIQEKEVNKGQTQPPKLFTESTLLKAMKNPIQYEKIEEHSENIKSLGTPATNDKYLPLLISRDYVSISKKNIIPSKLGIQVITSLSNTKITSIALTADIEYQIQNIYNNKLSYSKFMQAIVKYTHELTNEIKNKAENIGSQVSEKTKARTTCPKCKKGHLYMAKDKKNLYCSAYKQADEPCNFILFTRIAGHKLTQKNISDLLSHKKTKTLNLISSKKKPYKACIFLNDEYKTELEFINK